MWTRKVDFVEKTTGVGTGVLVVPGEKLSKVSAGTPVPSALGNFSRGQEKFTRVNNVVVYVPKTGVVSCSTIPKLGKWDCFLPQ